MAIFGKPSEEEIFVAAETNVKGRQRKKTLKSAPKISFKISFKSGSTRRKTGSTQP